MCAPCLVSKQPGSKQQAAKNRESKIENRKSKISQDCCEPKSGTAGESATDDLSDEEHVEQDEHYSSESSESSGCDDKPLSPVREPRLVQLVPAPNTGAEANDISLETAMSNMGHDQLDLATVFEDDAAAPVTTSTAVPPALSDEKIALINELLSNFPKMPIDVAHILADDALGDEPNLAQSFAAQQQSMQLSEFANSIDTPPLSLPQHDGIEPTVLKLRMMLDTGNSPVSICSNALN
eukprot:COSAG01_NODE_20073_length_972_cov_1.797251_1_plen_237_part_01